MEYIIILIFCIVAMILIYYAFEVNMRKIKESTKNEKIKKIVDKFPKNEEICKDILKILKNEKVKIKLNENDKDKTSLYVVLTDTISIANIKDIHTRIQTMAHECIHSIQNRKMLLFNFFYTSIYNLYFIISIILTVFRVYKNFNLQIIILLILGIGFYVVRSYLETDAMVRARYVAKDYMEKYNKENNICTDEEIEEIINEYDRINKYGIPTYNFILFTKVMSKIMVYCILAIIMISI